jgi:hypothetical protein
MIEEEKERIEENSDIPREEIFSNAVRAGKRTYFFDVKATQKNDYYITITESKKKFNKTGNYFYEKHKIFLYKEDFEKFIEALRESINFIQDNQGEIVERTTENHSNEFTNIQFDDLGEK